MANGWQADKRWSDRFIPEIKMILGLHLIGEPPVEEDAERNTDLMVLKLDAVRIACRIRKFQYAASYGSEFTLRSSRPSGAKTELRKVIEGWGDYIFYGFADEQEKNLCSWFLGDLKVFRVWFASELWRLPARTDPGVMKGNIDGSSSFHVFSIESLPDDFLIARQSLVPEEAAA